MLWPAPFRGRNSVSARVVIPGSKSVTNRALILAAQAQAASILKRPLISRDTELMVAGLKAMGVGITDIQIDGTAAFATVKEEGFWGTLNFTDYFSLSVLEGRWQITCKTFAHTGGSHE